MAKSGSTTVRKLADELNMQPDELRAYAGLTNGGDDQELDADTADGIRQTYNERVQATDGKA